MKEIVIASSVRTSIGTFQGAFQNISAPIGASGARITATLLHEMRRREYKLGIDALCIGGGQGIAAVFENA